MNYYRNKEKTDPKNPGNRKEGSPKDINDPFYGTGSSSGNIPAGDKLKGGNKAPSIHKEYDATENSGGPHPSTLNPED